MPSGSTVRPASIAEVKRELREILASRAFKQAPKLGRLLEYMCNKALLGEAEQVTEYTIAVDVFGKSENFKESKDSNVRVEVYRLRKRLAQFYETEGVEHCLRIFIPPGRYAPEFVVSIKPPEEERVQEGLPALSTNFIPPPVQVAREILLPSLARSKRRIGLYAAAAVALIIAVVLAVLQIHRPNSPQTAVKEAVEPQTRVTPAASPDPIPVAGPAPIRIMAGYSGPPRRDGSGAVWGPDQYFQGGRPGRPNEVRAARTNDPLLFQNSRIGDFSYDIPLAPGVYELHLYFVESEYAPEVGRGENDRTFFLHINEERLLPAFDIESEAMGANTADERIFKDIHPAADGKLHLAFESATGVPLINAIEVLPGIPHKQLPLRLVTQPVPFTDHEGQVWQADNYYLNGQTCPRSLVTGTPDPGLFALERYGHFAYAIPVDVRGRYTVALHFAEFYFGPSAPGQGGVGSRVFDVMCNGVLLLDGLDIFKEAGNGRALTKTFHHLKPTAQGKLNLTFQPVVNYALVFGIEVLDESK